MAHDIDSLIAFLDTIGLADVQHTHHDLRSHLIGTHAVLARWNLAEPVQRVGLFHSIYGTEGFPVPPCHAHVGMRSVALSERLPNKACIANAL